MVQVVLSTFACVCRIHASVICCVSPYQYVCACGLPRVCLSVFKVFRRPVVGRLATINKVVACLVVSDWKLLGLKTIYL